MRDGIPIFFSSCGKENGHSWSKEKTLRDELTGKAVNSPQAGIGRHELSKKSGRRLPAALYSFRPELRPPHLWVQSKMESKTESAHFYSRAFRFATHYPVRFRFYPRLSSFVPLGVGFQRRGPRPPAFVSLGVQGEVETPWCFSSGGVGRILFQKSMRLSSLRWKPSLAGAGNYAKARGTAARFLVIRNHDGCPSKFQALRKGK